MSAHALMSFQKRTLCVRSSGGMQSALKRAGSLPWIQQWKETQTVSPESDMSGRKYDPISNRMVPEGMEGDMGSKERSFELPRMKLPSMKFVSDAVEELTRSMQVNGSSTLSKHGEQNPESIGESYPDKGLEQALKVFEKNHPEAYVAYRKDHLERQLAGDNKHEHDEALQCALKEYDERSRSSQKPKSKSLSTSKSPSDEAHLSNDQALRSALATYDEQKSKVSPSPRSAGPSEHELLQKALAEWESKRPRPNSISGVAPVSDLSNSKEGRVDIGVHQALLAYETRNPGAYRFEADDLEQMLAMKNKLAKIASRSKGKVVEEGGVTDNAVKHKFALMALDPTTDSLTTTETSYSVSSTEKPLSLCAALTTLESPAKFLSLLSKRMYDGYEIVACRPHLVVLRTTTKPGPTPAPGGPNPVDGTTIPLPPSQTMSPTDYKDMQPVVIAREIEGHDKTYRGRKVRRIESVFSGRKNHHVKERKRAGAASRVVVTLVWATAACYIAGVAGEVVKVFGRDG